MAAAERYFGLRHLTSEELQGVLSGGVPSFQVVGLFFVIVVLGSRVFVY